MPGFASKQDRRDEAGFRFRSELPAGSIRAMLPFFPQAIAVKRSLDAAAAPNGPVLHYELIADFKTRTFYVDSSWVDQEGFDEWVSTDVHVRAMKQLGPRVTGGTFESEVVSPTAQT